MDWVSRWWHDEVLHGFKGPLLVSFLAFVLTFLLTRTITRMIRAGKGPFHNVSDGGVHLHHSTPGIVLLVAGAFGAVGAQARSPWAYLAAALVGVGGSLVLDEFAMIFHLDDDYWSQEGELSVNVVTLAAACIGLAVVGVSPTSGLGDTEGLVRGGVVAVLVVNLLLVATTAFKGKYPTALIGLFVAPVAWVAALRLARPTSPWARRFYSEAKRARAAQRAAEFDRRYGPVRQDWDDAVGGTPSASSPPAAHPE
jgi:ABC-type amino acid transport system permease subunit